MAQYQFDINAAMQAGYTPDQIQAYLKQQQAQGNQYQLTPTPQATPQQSQQPSNWLVDALPTVGSIVGGVAGAAIPGLGETGIGEIGGAAAGAGLGETARELIEGKPLDAKSIAGQTVLGGAGGAVGKGIGYVAGKVLPAATDGIAGRLMNSVYKEPIKATKAAISAGSSADTMLSTDVLKGLMGKVRAGGMDSLTDDEKALFNSVPLAKWQELSSGRPQAVEKALTHQAVNARGKTLGEEALGRGQVGTTEGLYNAAHTQINNTENTLQQLLMNSQSKVAMADVRKTVQPLIDKYTQSGNLTAALVLMEAGAPNTPAPAFWGGA